MNPLTAPRSPGTCRSNGTGSKQYPGVCVEDCGIRTPLLQDFVEAQTARRYVVKVFADAYRVQTGRIVNKDTSETLLVSHGFLGLSVKNSLKNRHFLSAKSVIIDGIMHDVARCRRAGASLGLFGKNFFYLPWSPLRRARLRRPRQRGVLKRRNYDI